MSVKAWNDEQEAELIKKYTEEGTKDVYELASHFAKGYRSVISKLVSPVSPPAGPSSRSRSN